jgi:hypothetical protein
LVHTPIHASWLNQVEIYFVLARGSSGIFRAAFVKEFLGH